MTVQGAGEGRQHDLDALRALLMLIGIPFHASLIYNDNLDWIIVEAERSHVLTFFAEFTHVFRMPAFFMVSGFFAVLMVRRRGPAAWFGSRCLRLGLPFVSAMLLLQPSQITASSFAPLARGDITYDQALLTAHAKLTSFGQQWIEHLWFLPVLLLASAIFVAAWPIGRLQVFQRGMDRFHDVCARKPAAASTALLLGAPLIETAQILALGVSPLGFIIHVMTCFGAGALLGSNRNLLNAFRRTNVPEIAGAIVLCSLAAVMSEGYDNIQPIYLIVSACGAILASKVIIATMYKFANRSSPAIKRVVDSSFSVYIVHQPIIVVVAALFCLVSLPIALEFVAIVAIATVLSFRASSLIARLPVLALLFNGIMPPSWSRLFSMRAEPAVTPVVRS